ncbi:MAG: hypothetical protein HYX87_03010 [Chloroflexi bacterium]|nr:hypothetical protein [Chloroflexota bacterium]
MRCVVHPSVETNLRCAGCEKPICPRCMVTTPVGMKCRDCAGLRQLPVFQVSALHYLKACGVGLLLAIAFGLAWTIVRLFVPYSGIFSFVIALGVGYGVAELMSRSVNRKRGTGLAVMAGAFAGICYTLSLLVFPRFFGLHYGTGIWDLLIVAAAIAVAVNQLR